ncbi:LOW QUALITY PROTEIN: tumor necrosis factor receptor superfamily member 6B [Numida meleagris]|uniref:LOW QUALITY PROTEIN: tumor necrosis factor receptor superfamily member 6B n=1 Tax=Numida meleagris TaxID=8996 RepID=UPI000B3DDF8B|nr:LOW QUALITY PROTEIN: tumor necrosis factor receptor superfamily member 6B [Numida meleagris]
MSPVVSLCLSCPAVPLSVCPPVGAAVVTSGLCLGGCGTGIVWGLFSGSCEHLQRGHPRGNSLPFPRKPRLSAYMFLYNAQPPPAPVLCAAGRALPLRRGAAARIRPPGAPTDTAAPRNPAAMLLCPRPTARRAPKRAFASLLLLLAELGCSSLPTYQWRDPRTKETVTCQQCPPGTFVAQHCTGDRPTACEPCPDLHYTHYWNYLEKCLYCNVICGERQVEVQHCNATHNRACQCQEGYHAELEFCVPHSECPPGSGVVKLGSPFENTQCRACPRGSFSSSSSSTEPCRPHQNCTQLGKETNVPGNQYHDTLCTSCRTDGSNSTRGPAPEDEDCEQAVIDFVAYQNIPLRKLKRLQQILERPPRKQAQETKAVVQEKLRAALTHRKQENSAVITELLAALRATKLTSIEKKARELFLLQ